MSTWIIIILIAVALIVMLMFNSIIYRKNQVNNAFAGIDTMLKKRYDLIPALAETVRGYMQYEKELLIRITELRQSYMEQGGQEEKIKTSDQMIGQMKEFFARVENYPDLKASENFLKLQASWNEMEDNIAAARRFYNSSVNDFHNIIEMFPTNLIAKLMHLKHRDYFSVKEEEKELEKKKA